MILIDLQLMQPQRALLQPKGRVSSSGKRTCMAFRYTVKNMKCNRLNIVLGVVRNYRVEGWRF